MATAEEREIVKKRREAILEYSRTHRYTGQRDLVEYLESIGLRVEQPQISKDLAALHLTPHLDKFGKKRLGVRSEIAKRKLPERYVKIFMEAVMEINVFNNWVIIETIQDCAAVVAYVVTANDWPETLSVMHGTKYVTIMTEDEDTATILRERLEEGIV